MQEERWAQCLAHAKGWVVFSCIIINSGCSFIFFVNLLILRVLQVLNVIDHRFQLLKKQTPLGPCEHPALNAVRAAQVLLSSQGPPPSHLSPGPSIQASPKELYPVLQSYHDFFGFPTSLLGSALSCSRLCHPSRSCFQASTASWESFLSSFGRALSLHSQGPSLRVRVLSSSLPLSFRLYYCVTSSLHFAIMSWHHYVTMAFLS